MIEIEVWTALALELANGPTAAMVVAGVVTGTKRAVLEVPDGAAVMEAGVDDAKPDVVEPGDADCEVLEDPAEAEMELEAEDPELLPDADELPEELPDELRGQ